METIKASELRIGNYVYFQNSESGKYENDLPIETGKELDDCDCQPILLTEEWLIRFGFEKNSYWFKDDNMIRFVFDENGWLHCSIGDNEKGFLYNRIKFVHQLQNLYFALTSQELEFKQ